MPLALHGRACRACRNLRRAERQWICGREYYGTEEHCEESPSGEHEADPRSIHVEHDGDAIYADVNCKHCGRSGCVGRLSGHDAVDW